MCTRDPSTQKAEAGGLQIDSLSYLKKREGEESGNIGSQAEPGGCWQFKGGHSRALRHSWITVFYGFCHLSFLPSCPQLMFFYPSVFHFS